MTQQSWYSNKELFEMMQGVTKEISSLRLELNETKTLIRDYNGLRETANKNTKRVGEIQREIDTLSKSRKEYVGYIIAAISTLFLILNYFK